MATILFAWELGAGLGHLVNLRPLVHGVAARGHRAVLVLRDLSRVRLVIPDSAAAVFQAPHQTREPLLSGEPCSFAQILQRVGFNEQAELGTLVEAWRNIYAATQPDLIVFDHSPTALLAAHGLPARRALLGAGFFCPADETPLPNLRAWTSPDLAQLTRDEMSVLDRINQILAAAGQPRLERVAQLYRQVDENFLLTFAELDPYGNRPGVHYRGVWTDAGGARCDWPAGPGKRVFAYLKPVPALPELFAALGQLKARVLVSADGFSPRLLARLSTDRVTIVPKPLSIGQVAADCDLAVLNGNHGTVAAMLLAGKPTLQIPIFLDQALIMQAVVRAGCGLGASPTGGDPIALRLASLLDEPRYADAARRFAARYAAYKPQEQIESIVDRLVELACNK